MLEATQNNNAPRIRKQLNDVAGTFDQILSSVYDVRSTERTRGARQEYEVGTEYIACTPHEYARMAFGGGFWGALQDQDATRAAETWYQEGPSAGTSGRGETATMK